MATFTFANCGSAASTEGAGSYWNYSNKEKDNYAIRLDGDVVELKQVQATSFEKNEPLFWSSDGKRVTQDTGRPVINFAVVIDSTQFGEVEWIFSPKTKRTAENPDGFTPALAAIYNGLVQAGIQSPSLDDLGGKNITVWTQEAPAGFSYGVNSPRPFGFKVNGPAAMPFRGCFPLTKDSQDAMPANMNPAMKASLMEARTAAANHPFQQAMGSMPPEMPVVMQQAMQGLPVQSGQYADNDIPF